jgi:hypothetical protein
MQIIDADNPLGLLFVASFAVQQILEALAWPAERAIGDFWRRRGFADDSWKKTTFGVIGFALGLYLAAQLDLHILNHYIPDTATASLLAVRRSWLDTVLTALVLSAGTEGTNSVLKYLKYLKEDKKAAAAETVRDVAEPFLGTTPTAVPVSPAAMRTLEKFKGRAGVAAANSASSRPLSFIGNK